MDENNKIHTRRKAAEADSKRIKETQERMTQLMRGAVNRIAASPDGQIFLNLIMRECGYQEPSLVLNPQTMDVNINTMIINEALRGLYVKLRRMIPDQYLKEIEFMNLRKKAEEIVLEQQGEAE